MFLIYFLAIKKNSLSLHSQNEKSDGAIAQLVEQRTENPCVPGSIPGGTTFKRLQVWQIPEIKRFQGFVFLRKPHFFDNIRL